MSRAASLLLADGRFPSGAHAHSAGVEAACAIGAIRDVPTLRGFLEGRLHTTGRVDAAFAAAAATGEHRSADLDAALEARLVSPRQREVSRSLGRQLLRAGERIWPHPGLAALRAASAGAPHHAVALGVLAAAAGLDDTDAAVCALHHLASAAATAAVRLLGLDPFDVHALLASMAAAIDELACEAAAGCRGPLGALPASSGPLTEILAEDHANWEVRLFAS